MNWPKKSWVYLGSLDVNFLFLVNGKNKLDSYGVVCHWLRRCVFDRQKDRHRPQSSSPFAAANTLVLFSLLTLTLAPGYETRKTRNYDLTLKFLLKKNEQTTITAIRRRWPPSSITAHRSCASRIFSSHNTNPPRVAYNPGAEKWRSTILSLQSCDVRTNEYRGTSSQIATAT